MSKQKLEQFKAFFYEHLSEFEEVQSSANTKFQRMVPFVTGHQGILEFIIDTAATSATLRLYLGNFFANIDDLQQIDYMIHKLNQEYRFASFYATGNTLIAENDFLIHDGDTMESYKDYIDMYPAIGDNILTQLQEQ